VTETQVRELREQGYSIVERVLEPELCAAVLAEFAAMDGTWKRSLVQAFHSFDTVRYFDLLNAADVFQRIPVHTAILPVARAVLGDDCQLGSFGSVSIGPGEPAQGVHVDDMLYRLERPHPDIYLNVMIALVDYTDENGATRIIPGSHRWPHNPPLRTTADVDQDAEYVTIPAEMPADSVCFFLGSTYHGGGANHSNHVRHGMTLAYCAPWVRPQENFLVAVSQERAATFDPDLQALIGYRTGHGTSLGHIYTQPEHWSGPMAHRLVHD